jgi:hypothetical protein
MVIHGAAPTLDRLTPRKTQHECQWLVHLPATVNAPSIVLALVTIASYLYTGREQV